MIIRLIVALLLLPSAVLAWSPPIGIPAPTWPSDLDVARPTMPSPWTSDQAGWYFIQASGCSDSRTYGNPTASRCTAPTSPAAGSKVVFNGTVNFNNVLVSASGTSGNPVWFMGYNTESRPTLTGIDNGAEGYIIFDNINFSGSAAGGFGTGDHIMMRNCNFTNTYTTSNYSLMVTTGDTAVIYGCVFGPSGNWAYTGSSDLDMHGIKVYQGTSNLWVVDSTFYHLQGDGVQSGDSSYPDNSINYVYIGRNTGYENLQSCFWVKTGYDVIISENTCYNIDVHDSSGSAVGQAYGAQYDPKYVWFLANTMHDTWAGIHIAGPDGGGGGPFYAIGNLAYNIAGDYDCAAYDAGAIGYRNDGGFTAIYNTIYNSEAPYTGANGAATFRNNIVSVKPGSCGVYSVSGQTVTADYNLVSDASWITETHEKAEASTSTFTSVGTDFTLKSTSLAVGNANPTEEAAFAAFQTRYGIDIRKDILGTTRPQSTTWDIGAYEYTSGGGDTTAPTATITSPSSAGTHSSSTTPMTSLSGTASDDTAVTEVTWSCPTCTPTSGTASGTTTWSVASIGLASGDNTITVTAHDAANNTGTDSHIETYTPPPASTSVATGVSMSGCSIN